MSKAKFFLSGNRDNQINPQTEYPTDIYFPVNNGRDVQRNTAANRGVGTFLSTIPNESVSLRGWLVNYLPDIMQESSNTIWPSNYLFVSKDLYNSQTPVKGDPTNPYPTPWAAAAAAVDGDIIYVLDGVYTVGNTTGDLVVTAGNQASLVPSTWTTGEYTFVFAPGTGVSDTTTSTKAVGHLFEVVEPITVRVLGQGEFSKTTAGTLGSGNNAIINQNDADSVFEFEAKSITFNGFIYELAAAAVSTFNVDTITARGDFGLFSGGSDNCVLNWNINKYIASKDATGGTDYTWEWLTIRNANGIKATINVGYADIYGHAGFLLHGSSDNIENSNINVHFGTYKYDNDGVGADVSTFGSLYAGDTDDVGNSVTKGAHVIWFRGSTGVFSNNTINVTADSVYGDRLRLVEVDIEGASDNNRINIDINSSLVTGTNALVVTALRGAQSVVNVNANTSGEYALINQGDASATGRINLSGIWGSTANSAIINATGPGAVLSNFIGRGGSTASPITTSGSGDVAVLSAAFNNVTAITGTTSGATPLQDAGF